MTSVWKADTFQVFLDRTPIPRVDYCALVPEAAGREVLRPSPPKVKALIRRGASLVLDDMQELAEGPKAFTSALQAMTGGKVQGNLYFSMRQRQAFGPHFDDHEVFAVHCSGEKVWRIYEGRVERPIPHPIFSRTAEQNAKAAGRAVTEVTMRPGDLLYIPRGRYHDALASENGSVHIAFGAVLPKYLDLLSALWSVAVHRPVLRGDLPPNPAPAQVEAALKTLVGELSELARAPDVRTHVERTLTEFPYTLDGYDVADLVSRDPVYLLRLGIEAKQEGRRLTLTDGKNAVPVPDAFVEAVSWIVERREVSRSGLAEAYPHLGTKAIEDLLENLRKMKVLQ
ncbi:MAG: JmjC domain-containing protein [Methyloceanibacter sp.]